MTESESNGLLLVNTTTILSSSPTKPRSWLGVRTCPATVAVFEEARRRRTRTSRVHPLSDRPVRRIHRKPELLVGLFLMVVLEKCFTDLTIVTVKAETGEASLAFVANLVVARAMLAKPRRGNIRHASLPLNAFKSKELGCVMEVVPSVTRLAEIHSALKAEEAVAV